MNDNDGVYLHEVNNSLVTSMGIFLIGSRKAARFYLLVECLPRDLSLTVAVSGEIKETHDVESGGL